MDLTRRQLLGLGAAGTAAALLGVGVVERDRLVDTVDPPSAPQPTASPGPVYEGRLDSRARGRSVGWAAAYPPGSTRGDALPVARVLHGRRGDHRTAFRTHHLHRFLAAAVETGTPPYALVSVDGGEDSYWHPRRDGDDPQAMLLDELLPMLAGHGLRTDRFGVTGWSMGGYGALLLAETVPQRVRAVAVDAAALWRKASDTAAGAFDGRADFAAHDVLGHLDRMAGVPLRVGCGRSDPFIGTNRLLARLRPDAEHAFPRGGHDVRCWDQLRPGDLRFLGRHLAG